MDLNEKIGTAFQAAQSGDAKKLENLLLAEPNLANMENSEGLTLLGFSAHFGHKDTVKVLLEYKADVNAISHSKVSYIPSNTALHASIAGERNEDVIKLLLKHNAVTTLFDSNGHTCLHSAAFLDDNIEIIRVLIEHGARVNEKAEGGVTALTLAIGEGNNKVAAFLRQNGARE